MALHDMALILQIRKMQEKKEEERMEMEKKKENEKRKEKEEILAKRIVRDWRKEVRK